MKLSGVAKIVGMVCYVLFITVSLIFGFDPGKEIFDNFLTFALGMLKILPCAFILIGLFEVWVKREAVERHFGEESGMRGYFWAIVLSATTIGGLYVSFPVAYSLHNKGAKLGVIFTYIAASGICRVPMTIFEASFMGARFSAIRLLVSLPLVILTSMALGNYLTKRDYKITEGR